MMRLRAYAKLNVSLIVHHRRPDGYHEIESVVQTVDLADDLTVSLGGGSTIVDNDLQNLIGPDLGATAAEALLHAKGRADGAQVSIRKGIPAGAGLGGGSSDAACILSALDRMTPPPLPRKALCALAADIGSDVPLFLRGGRLWMGGRGERIEAVSDEGEEAFVLVVPPVQCDTGAVYRAWDRTRSKEASRLVLGENGLRSAAVAVYPHLARYDAVVRGIGGMYAGMSGSGSTFFAAFDRSEPAEAAAERLVAALPEAHVWMCRPTPRGHDLVKDEADADRH